MRDALSVYCSTRAKQDYPRYCTNNPMNFETIAAQAAHQIDPATGAVAPPIYLSTTFERDADGEYSRGFVYSRSDNPNRRALEQCLAMLEGGEESNAASTAFASGSAATAAVFQALAPGDHVIAPDDCYHGTSRMLREIFAPWGRGDLFCGHERCGRRGRALRASQHAPDMGGNAVKSLAQDNRHRPDGLHRPDAAGAMRVPATIPGPARCCNGRSNWAPTWWCIQPPST